METSPVRLTRWSTLVSQDAALFDAWLYALGCGQTVAAHGMLAYLEMTKSLLSPQFAQNFETHRETELRHAEWLQRPRKAALAARDISPEDHSLEKAMCQAVENYVRTFLGYVQRGFVERQEAEYCAAALALGSRLFRHLTELERACGSIETACVLRKMSETEARQMRIAQAHFEALPRETHGIYRSVRSFEEILFERMIRKLLQAFLRKRRPAASDSLQLVRCV